jgi:deoxyribonuclease-4
MFGSHLSVAGGLYKAVLAAEKYGMETVQVFTANPRGFSLARALDPAVVEAFKKEAGRVGFRQVVAHDSYLINLAAAKEELWNLSVKAFGEEMRRCDQLGIPYVVTHPGAHCGTGEECGVGRVIEGLNALFETPDLAAGKVTVCLETTAGQGTCLGCTFEQLAAMRAGVAEKHRHRIAYCVDTCHILAAGYDLSTRQTTREVLKEMDRVLGLEYVKVWHLNDSKKPRGSRVDRHEHLGRGCVGLEAFAEIVSHEAVRDVPKIMETPKDKAPDGREWDVLNLELLRTMAAGKVAVLHEFKPAKKPSKKATPSRKVRQKK